MLAGGVIAGELTIISISAPVQVSDIRLLAAVQRFRRALWFALFTEQEQLPNWRRCQTEQRLSRRTSESHQIIAELCFFFRSILNVKKDYWLTLIM